VALLHSVSAAERSEWFPQAVLVVTQDLPELEAGLQARLPDFPLPLRCHFAPGAQSIGALRNAGLRAVRTQWVHAVDSDTLVPADYFTRLAAALRAPPAAANCYQLNFAPAPGASRWARYEAQLDQATLSRYINRHGVAGLNGMNFLGRVQVLLAAGGFDETLVAAEDVELGYRLHRAGNSAIFLPDVVIWHRYTNNLRPLLKRKFWHGRGYSSGFYRFSDLFRRLPAPPELRRFWFLALLRPGLLAYYAMAMAAFWAGIASHQCQRLRPRQPSPRCAEEPTR
jgi:GT2 family glycosyltransferase